MSALNIQLFDPRRFIKSANSQRLAKGFFWNLVGDSLSKVLLMLSAFYVAKLLGPAEFGKWGIVQSTTMMFSILLGFGIGVTATKFLAEYKNTDKVKAGRFLSLSIYFSVAIGIILMIILIAGGEYLAVVVFKDSSLGPVIKLSSLFLFFNSISGVLSGCLVGLEKFKKIAFINLVGGLVGSVFIIFFCKKFHLNGVVWGYSIYYLLSDVLLFFYLVKESKAMDIHFSFDFQSLRLDFNSFFSLSIPAFVSAAIGGPTVWCLYAIIANQPNGFVYLGIFNLTKILQNALIQFGTQLNNPLMTLMSEKEDGDYSDKMNFAIPWLVITFLAFPFIIVPEFFTIFLKNGSYNVPEIGKVVSTVAFTTYVMIFKQAFARKIITTNLMWWGVIENALWAVSILIIAPILSRSQGVIGLPYAYALVYFVDLLILLPFYYRKGLISGKIFSWQSICCWSIILFSLLMNYLNVQIGFRLILGLMSMAIQAYLIYYLFFKRR